MKTLVLRLSLAAAVPVAVLAQDKPPAATAQTAAPVPLASFAQFPDIQGPDISPGGKVVAAKVRFEGKQALAIFPLGVGAKPEIIAKDGAFDAQGDRVIHSWRWCRR